MTPGVLLVALMIEADGSGSASGSDPIEPPAAIVTQPGTDQREGPLTLRPPNVVVPAVHVLGLMSVMRVTETFLWPEPFARTEWFGWSYEQAFTKPPKFDSSKPFMQWDGDPWVINTFGHGLFGSELYLRARQCRFGWAGSLAFAAASSAIWEYGFEANGVRPSALDLVYTPLAGIGLGELRYILYRAAGRLESKVSRGIVRSVADPLGEFERVLGTDC